MLPLIVKSIKESRIFSEEKYETLSTKCVLYSNKLLKKPDQVRAICMTSYLFSNTSYSFHRDGKKVLECLQKALKIADTCMDALTNIQLFVEILNYYIYFYKRGITSITINYIESLIDLIQANLNNLEFQESSEQVSKLFNQTVSYYQNNQEICKLPEETHQKLSIQQQEPAISVPEMNNVDQSDSVIDNEEIKFEATPTYEINEEQPW